MQKNSMYAEIPPDAIPILKPSLQEGRILAIRKFFVKNAKPQFKVVDGPYMIKLNKRTQIAQVHPEPLEFPRYVYTLTPIAELPDHVNKKDKFLGNMYLVHIYCTLTYIFFSFTHVNLSFIKFPDVIRQVVAISNAALVRNSFGKQQMKRIVILRDER